ncbi:MAG: ATP-binding cassette domain-containing protein [Bacilli bacterium]|nr:ATP-binding cassette domain-containing protein [Bacilli bacterium]
MNNTNEEKKVLLKVEHLEQFFKLGHRVLRAVNDVSFDIYKGEVFGLVGESGCGKTTTGRSIIRLYDCTGGSVYFDGKRICAGIRPYKQAIKDAKLKNRQELASYKAAMKQAIATGSNPETEKEKYLALAKASDEALIQVVRENTAQIESAKHDHKYCNREFAEFEMQKVRDRFEPELAKETDPEKLESLEARYKEELKLARKDRIMNKIQMIFQDPIASLDPRMTVRDIIAEGLIIRGIKDKKYIDEQVFKILDLVGLVPEHATRYPHEFSGGQRQRIGIARAIILNPELVIADEPISALDVSIQAQVINLLRELSDRMGLTTMFIAHDLAVVKYFSNRIAVMYYGKIVELASSDELFKHPLHPYTKSLLSAIPFPDPFFEKKRKRTVYNPLSDHDYSTEQPIMREITPGHFVYCNSVEFEKYQTEIKES